MIRANDARSIDIVLGGKTYTNMDADGTGPYDG